jgi:mono/diheme cytochrome c family protein
MRPKAIYGCLVASILASGAASAAPSEASLRNGERVYLQHCAACHGETGAGDGAAAVWLFPKPRDFSAGSFKIQSTPAGSLPTDEDLYDVITRGMPGSSMPSFSYLTEGERQDVVAHLKELTSYTGPDGKQVSHFAEAQEAGRLAAPIQVPQEPPITLQAITRGKELFTQLACNTCHGETGAGDGPSAALLKDNWGLPLPPRDFNSGAFRGGSTGRDLYLRIAAGMAGTPMPPYGEEAVTPEDRWAVVHYIQSLRRKDIAIHDILAPADDTIRAIRLQQALPLHPFDSAWDRFDTTRVPLNPLWPVPDHAPAVAVRAVHDGKRIAFLLQWRDPIADGAPIRAEDFQDGIALQFSMNGTAPFVGMGDSNNPVNIWHWKAGWQQETEFERPDVNTEYVSMYVDVYPETTLLYHTAEAAGNILAQSSRLSPVEDANARGFGTFTPQPPGSQNVRGHGIWRDGHWQVVITRDLSSRDRDDVQFDAGKQVPVSFAVWDGQTRDRNGRKLISNWYQLVLEP